MGDKAPERRDHPRKDHRNAFLRHDPGEFDASQAAAAYKLPDFRKNKVVEAEKAAGKEPSYTRSQMGYFAKRESSAPKNVQRDTDAQNKPSKIASTSGQTSNTLATSSRSNKRVDASSSDSENNEELPDVPKRKSPAKARKQGTTPQQRRKASHETRQNPSESEDEFILVDRATTAIPGMAMMFSSQESARSQSASQASQKRKTVASTDESPPKTQAKRANKIKQSAGSSSESESDTLPPVSKKAKTASTGQGQTKRTTTTSSASSKPPQLAKNAGLTSKVSAATVKPDHKGKGKAIESRIEDTVAGGKVAQNKLSVETQATGPGRSSQLQGKDQSELPRSTASPPKHAQQGTGVERKASSDNSKPSLLQSGPSFARSTLRTDSTDSDESDCVDVAASRVTIPSANASKAAKSSQNRQASNTSATRPFSPRKSDAYNDRNSSIPPSASSDATATQPRRRARPKVQPSQGIKPIPVSSAEIVKGLGITPKASKAQKTKEQPKALPSSASTSKETTARRARPTKKALEAEAEKARRHLKESDVNRKSVVQGKQPECIDITSSPLAPKKPEVKVRRKTQVKINLTDDEEDTDIDDLPDASELFNNAAAGVEDIFSSQSTGTSVHEDRLEDEDNDSEGELTMAYTQAPNITTSLRCPFCDGALPDKPSEKLITMLVKLCSREDIKVRKVPTNDLALSLPMTVTIEACKRHREETETIPRGLEAGYPDKESIDWKRLETRIEIISAQLTEIVYGSAKSSFFEAAKKEWQAKGARKMGNVMNEFASFQQEMPGYYGFKGFELIMAALKKHLVDDGIITAARTQPLDINTFLRRVLVPEAAVRLIQTDRKNCSAKEAMVILEESRAYGAAVFGQDASTAGNESKREKKEREREQQEFQQSIQAILSSQEAGSTALQRGRDAIVALHTLLAKQA